MYQAGQISAQFSLITGSRHGEEDRGRATGSKKPAEAVEQGGFAALRAAAQIFGAAVCVCVCVCVCV